MRARRSVRTLWNISLCGAEHARSQLMRSFVGRTRCTAVLLVEEKVEWRVGIAGLVAAEALNSFRRRDPRACTWAASR